MGKFDFNKTIKRVQDTYKKDPKMQDAIGLGNALESISNDPEDYIILPEWYKAQYGVMGLKFGHIVQWAGKSDSGKTSFSKEAMIAAQKQGRGIIYVETEGKTGPEDLAAAGIDPDGVICVHSPITEIAFELGLKAWDSFFVDYPKEKLLFVYDSYGNTVSQKDSAMSLTQNVQQVGGHAKTNKAGISIMIAKMTTDPVAVLIVNRTISNIGSPGQTNAGGDALNFFSMLTVQATRRGWYEKTVDGIKVRAGAFVNWTTYKNHYAKALKGPDGESSLLLPKMITMKISDDGLAPQIGATNDKEDS